MKIVEKFLAKTSFNKIQNFVESSQLPWFYLKSTASELDEEIDYGSSFNCTLFNSWGRKEPLVSKDLELFEPIINNIADYIGNPIQLIRARLGLITQTPYRVVHSAHVDFLTPHHTALFYFSTCEDAPTIFYDSFYNPKDDKNSKEEVFNLGKKVEKTATFKLSPCIENNLVIFDGLQYHSSTSPVLHNRRIVLNVNFIKV